MQPNNQAFIRAHIKVTVSAARSLREGKIVTMMIDVVLKAILPLILRSISAAASAIACYEALMTRPR